MQKFVDTAGRVWVVEINVATIKRVRRLTEVNLLEVVEGELIERLSRDPVLLCDVLYAVCQPQALRDGVSDEQFGSGLAGDCLGEATAALLSGLVAFFPEPRRRLLAKAAEKYQAVEARSLAMVETKIESPEFEATLMERVEQALAESTQPESTARSTGSPELSGSTPDR